MGALLIWAPSTRATIWASVVSRPTRVARTSSTPVPFTVPACVRRGAQVALECRKLGRLACLRAFPCRAPALSPQHPRTADHSIPWLLGHGHRLACEGRERSSSRRL